jgi:hypothetical protein
VKNTSNKLVRIGDRVRWESAAGAIRGEIVDISLGLNANEELVPWLTVEYYRGDRSATRRIVRVQICGTDSNLKMMKFTVIFRDIEKQLETV